MRFARVLPKNTTVWMGSDVLEKRRLAVLTKRRLAVLTRIIAATL
jgi:hypothetical protein